MDLAGMRMAKEMGLKYDSEGKVGHDVAKAAGVEIIQMPAGEMAKWKDAVGGIYKKWIEDMNAKGLPGQRIYEKTNEFIKKYE
jgi:hypothetical protein